MGNHIGIVLDNDGATGARRLVGARPVEHGRGSCPTGSVKIPIDNGVREEYPLGLHSPLDREGVTLRILKSKYLTKKKDF
jgi:hypothetical protein